MKRAIFMLLAVLVLFGGCRTKEIIEHHHHYAKTDSLSMQVAVDEKLHAWVEKVDSTWMMRIDNILSEQQSQEQEHETVTETITTFIDSLGREVSQQQRTTERNISRQQQQREERIISEYEQLIRQLLSEKDSDWQVQVDMLQKQIEQRDSVDINKTTKGSGLSLMDRIIGSLWLVVVIGTIVAFVVFILKKIKD